MFLGSLRAARRFGAGELSWADPRSVPLRRRQQVPPTARARMQSRIPRLTDAPTRRDRERGARASAHANTHD